MCIRIYPRDSDSVCLQQGSENFGFSGDSNAPEILETIVHTNFLVLELSISVCLPSCLENKLFEKKDSVTFIFILMLCLVSTGNRDPINVC